jgi:hypothetical protein
VSICVADETRPILLCWTGFSLPERHQDLDYSHICCRGISFLTP